MTVPSPDNDAPTLPRSFASLLDGHYDRATFLRGLKQLIATARERIHAEHTSGARGRNVVRHLTALVDDVVRTVWQFATAAQGLDTAPCALLALGGYGRGELNPHSDVDLMFLCQKADAHNVIRETLYLLWDVGYTLGYSVRTTHDAVRIAHTDLTAQTAMLEARFVDGDFGLFQTFQEEVSHRRFTRHRRRTFARQKREACQRRHAAYANTVNLMEPNVKESPGGLRDYHTGLWLAMASYEVTSLADMVDCGLVQHADRIAVETALDWLFRVRNALHYHHGRKNDLLSVDVQEKLAAGLGFEAGTDKQAVEHFLNTYYVQANVIYDFCCTILAAVAQTYQPQWRRFWQRSRRLEDGFILLQGSLTHEALPDRSRFAAQPRLLMQAFAVAHTHNVAFAPELSRAIKSQAFLLAAEPLRRSPDLKALFFHILALPHAAPVLRAMHRHGLLAAYIPEFGALTCLVQYDLYHRYTVDEHTLHSIAALESLAVRREAALRPLASLYQQTPDRALLKFALLLHDLGKDVGPGKASHVYRSGELADIVCDRLDLPDEQRHFIRLMVVNHLVMNHLAQRRDITDPKVIAEFAQTVETVMNLEQLYLLTFADTSAVGPDVWTIWKGALLADLYRRTVDYLVYQTDLAPSRQKLCERLRPAILACLDAQTDAAAVEHFLATMSSKYLLATPAEQIAKHVGLTQPRLSAPVVLDTEQAAGLTTVTICMESRRGVFAMIAGALSRNRLNILGAQIFTSTDGMAIDTLQVETVDQTPVTDAGVWQRVEADLLAALTGARDFDEVLTQRRNPVHERRFQAFALPPHVEVDNTLSDSYTVIEIQTQDRLGLLYKLTRLLYEQGLDIALAKISTEANKAIDVFYVTDAEGGKVVDLTTTSRIEQALLAALD